ncbi:MAG TPA: aspartate carbamoyltransferase catalytic subunit [Sphingomonadales bacterium]|nr:aspartate carbamoyltransferase catalytic subunit [Sphingomonadales bacterium]
MSARRTSAKARHLLGLAGLSKPDIEKFLKRAEAYRRARAKGHDFGKKRKGQTLVNLFFEPSTRTRVSFELAAYQLGMSVVNFAAEASSVRKGETLTDTFRNLAAMGPAAIVVRAAEEGAVARLAAESPVPVINAGDGAGEHPTQALVDALTLMRAKGRLQGLKVAIIGDIAHSRVARSNFHLLPKFGVKVAAFGPGELMPKALPPGTARAASMDEALSGADAVMMLRIQIERMKERPLPLHNYHAQFGLHAKTLALAKKDAVVLHPGPMNRGLEIADEVADDPKRSLVLEQVANGVAVRMAVLDLLTR